MKHIHEYEILLDFLVRVVESTKGTLYSKETAWIKDTQPLGAKLFMHCGSVYHLAHNTRVPNVLNKGISFVDHHSIIVLVRTIHELYLAFNYIYIAPSTNELRAFRHSIWELGAFLDRQKFPATLEESKRKQEEEKSVVKELTDAVEKDKIFKSLSASEQQKALRGEWRLNYGWVDLAEFASLDKEQFRSAYRYLCSYAHTGHLSIFQMQAEPDDSFSIIDTWIDSTMAVISHFIYDYMKLYPKSVGLFREFPEAEKLVYVYDGIGREK